jgi:hypothetical protein
MLEVLGLAVFLNWCGSVDVMKLCGKRKNKNKTEKGLQLRCSTQNRRESMGGKEDGVGRF